MLKQNNIDTLYHHGILGMKWGIRRYQNKDGTLTPAGKKRADKMKEEYTALTGKRLIRKPTSKNAKSQNQNKDDKKKNIKDMSDTELRDRINRLKMEKEAKGLENDLGSKGQKFVSSVGKEVIAPAAKEAGKRLLTDMLMKIGKEKLGLNPEETKDALGELRKEVDNVELKKRKLAAEDWISKHQAKEAEKKAKEANKAKESKKDTEETVDTEIIPPNPKDGFNNKSSEKRKNIIIDDDSLWEEVPVNSTAIVPYKQSGKSFIDDLLNK